MASYVYLCRGIKVAKACMISNFMLSAVNIALGDFPLKLNEYSTSYSSSVLHNFHKQKNLTHIEISREQSKL